MAFIGLVLALGFACLLCSYDSVTGAGYSLFFLVLAIISLFRNSVDRDNLNSPLLWLVVVPGTLLACFAWNSPIKQFGESDFILIISGVMSCFVSVGLAKQAQIYSKLSKVFGILMLYHLGMVLVHELVDANWLPFYRIKEDVSQISGGYVHRNYLGNLLACFSAFFVAGVFFSQRQKLRVYSIVLTALSYAFVVWTGSRGTMLAACCASMAVTAFYVYSLVLDEKLSVQKVLKLFTGGILLLIISGYAFFQAFSARDLTNIVSANGREAFAKIAVELIIDKPLFGGGARSFEWRSVDFWPEDLWKGVGHMNYVHNEFLQAVVDYGIVAGGFFVGCIFALLVILLWQFRRVSNSFRSAFVGSFGIVVVFLVQCLVSFPLHVLPNLMILSVAIGLMIGIANRSKFRHKLVYLAMPLTSSVISIGFAILLVPRHYSLVNRDRMKTEGAGVIEAQASLVDVRGYYKDYRMLGDLYFTHALNHQEAFEESMKMASKAYGEARKLHPYDLQSQAALGVSFDYLGHFKRAGEELHAAAGSGAYREPYYRIHRKLGQHYYAWGIKLYNSRQPRKAKFCMEKAEEYLDQTNRLAWCQGDESWVEEKKKVREYLDFFEKSGIISESVESL